MTYIKPYGIRTTSVHVRLFSSVLHSHNKSDLKYTSCQPTFCVFMEFVLAFFQDIHTMVGAQKNDEERATTTKHAAKYSKKIVVEWTANGDAAPTQQCSNRTVFGGRIRSF